LKFFKAVEYSWDFGDGNTSMLEKPLNKYSKPGTYFVNLTARNQDAPKDYQFAYLTKNVVVK
jgi:PKD repeat protein